MVLLLHFRVHLISLYVKPKWALLELEPKRLMPPSKGEHLEQVQTSRTTPISPKAKPIYSHMVGRLYLVHMKISTMIGWTIGSRVQ